MLYSLLAYNSSVHPTTKQKPFDIVNGHTDCLDPFDVTNENILNNYIIEHKKRLKLIFDKIHEQSQQLKDTSNHKASKSLASPINESAILSNKKLSEVKSHLSKVITDDISNKIKISNKTIHHSKRKIEKKLKNNFSLQDDQNFSPDSLPE
jgi:hypothetical protein